MDSILNFLLDFYFYGFLDSIIMYLFVNKLFLNKKIEFTNMIKHCLIISFGISIIATLFPVSGILQILMGIYIGLCFYKFYKTDIFKSILYGLFSILFVFLIEVFFGLFLNDITNIKILSFRLNNLYRLSCFMFLKFIEIIIVLGVYKMKVLFGGIVRR